MKLTTDQLNDFHPQHFSDDVNLNIDFYIYDALIVLITG